MPGAFTSVTATTASAVPITATVTGNTIQIQESVASSGFPNSDYIVYKAVPPAVSGPSVASSVGRQVQAGGTYNFSKGMTVPEPFYPGEIVGFVKAVTATITVVVDEQGA